MYGVVVYALLSRMLGVSLHIFGSPFTLECTCTTARRGIRRGVLLVAPSNTHRCADVAHGSSVFTHLRFPRGVDSVLFGDFPQSFARRVVSQPRTCLLGYVSSTPATCGPQQRAAGATTSPASWHSTAASSGTWGGWGGSLAFSCVDGAAVPSLTLHRGVVIGFDLAISSDVPLGSGLSSSAALEVRRCRCRISSRVSIVS